jgi:hypothetical protein
MNKKLMAFHGILMTHHIQSKLIYLSSQYRAILCSYTKSSLFQVIPIHEAQVLIFTLGG